MARAPIPAALALLAAAAAAPGCVERRLLLRSEPAGLEVSVNGVPAGTTPVEVPFTWYGTVRVETRPADADGNGWPEVHRLVTGADLAVPWYERFPLDFFSENLLPFTVTDRHEVTLRPRVDEEPATDEDLRRSMDAMRRSAGDLKVRAERARVEAEAEAAADAAAGEAGKK